MGEIFSGKKGKGKWAGVVWLVVAALLMTAFVPVFVPDVGFADGSGNMGNTSGGGGTQSNI
jgi:hypothetical protein